MTLIPGNLSINMCNICNKIHQKSTKYPLLEPPWGTLGTILAALGKQDAPKRRPTARRRRQNFNFSANLVQLGSNVEAQTLPKSVPNAAQDPPRCSFTTTLAFLSPLSAFALIFIGLSMVFIGRQLTFPGCSLICIGCSLLFNGFSMIFNVFQCISMGFQPFFKPTGPVK